MSDMQIIVFAVAAERYGVDVAQVRSIERVPSISRVPRTLPFIKGVINLRGTVTPVMDLRGRFGFPDTEYGEDSRIVVVEVDQTTIGLIVDAVMDVTTLDASAIQPPPALVGGVQAVYLNGVAQTADGLLILLNLERVLSEAEASQLKLVEESMRE